MKARRQLSRPRPLCKGLLLMTTILALECMCVWAKKPPQPPPEPPPEPQVGYRLVDLVGSESRAYKINEAGWVAGEMDDPAGQSHAFVAIPEDTDADGLPEVWTRDNNGDGLNDLLVDLGYLGGSIGEQSSSAQSINHLGQVVGYTTVNGGAMHAMMWQDVNGNRQSDPGEMLDLGAMSPGGWSVAWAINNLGQVVGLSDGIGFLINPSDVNGDGKLDWFLDDGNGGNALMIDLGSPFGDGATPRAINDVGEIVGSVGSGYSFLLRPEDVDGDGKFDWFAGIDGINTLMIPLPPLPGGDICEATAINSSGQVLGSSRDDDNNRTAEWYAVRWGVDAAGTVSQVNLGRMTGEENTRAQDLNDLGQAVGCAHTPRGKFPNFHDSDTAWLYHDGNFIGLPDLTVDRGPFDGDTEAYGLNERTEIVGAARIGGVRHAYVAVPVTAP